LEARQTRTRGERRGNIWRRGEATEVLKSARPLCFKLHAFTRALLLLPNVRAVSFGALVYSRRQKAPAALFFFCQKKNPNFGGVKELLVGLLRGRRDG